MKLNVTHSQTEKRGLFRGIRGMTLMPAYSVELEPEEAALVEKYEQWDIPVHAYENGKRVRVIWTLRDMVDGKTVDRDGVMRSFKDEEQIRYACKNLRILLNAMASFDGENGDKIIRK